MEKAVGRTGAYLTLLGVMLFPAFILDSLLNSVDALSSIREGYSFPLEVQEPKLWTAASEDLREVVLQGQN